MPDFYTPAQLEDPMPDFYTPAQRALQERFETVKMADLLAPYVHAEIRDAERAFIESRDMFFLSTVDGSGQPTCSYKGGDPGFVRVVDRGTIAFPSYDGNGMYLSLGNLRDSPKIGMLFLDFEKPHRLRVHGTASVQEADPLLAEYPGAELVVRVAVSSVFINCPRYIHRYTRVALSRYVPRTHCETPFAEWKRVDVVQDALPPRDQGKAARAGGTITTDEYGAKLAAGEA